MARDWTNLTLPLRTARLSLPIRVRAGRMLRSSGLWAMGDQAAASLGNFATNIILARTLASESYGTFGLILEGIFFLNAIQSALVTYPLSVHGATCDRTQLSRYASASLLLTLILAAPVVTVAMIAGAMSGQLLLAACASLALVMWQLQETLRRAMFAHLRHADAIRGDAISYLGQAACLLGLVGLKILSLEATFTVIALTSTLAAIMQAGQVGLIRVTLRELLDHGRQFIKYGRFLAASNLTAVFSTLGYSWTLTAVHGRAAAAELFAILTLIKLTNPMINAVVGLLVPAAARANDAQGPRAAQRVAAKYSWMGAAVLVPYFMLLVAFPSQVIELFFGQGSIYAGDANVLRLFVACSALTYAVSTTSSYFSAIHQSRVSFMSQSVNAAVSLFVGLPLVYFGGLAAAATGTLLGVAAQLATLLHHLGKTPAAAPEPEIAEIPAPLPLAA